MKPATILTAMADARTDMELIAGIRRQKEPSIATGKDRLAKKWQKRVRQHNKFFKRLYRVLRDFDYMKERILDATTILELLFDDGEGGDWRGDINQFLVRNRRN